MKLMLLLPLTLFGCSDYPTGLIYYEFKMIN